jgi:hypothetical protein
VGEDGSPSASVSADARMNAGRCGDAVLDRAQVAMAVELCRTFGTREDFEKFFGAAFRAILPRACLLRVMRPAKRERGPVGPATV